MPLYNKERDVARAIRSALAQTFTDYELIVVNDGSTDRSVNAVATFNDPRIRLAHQENQGVSAARNRGVSEAQAELVAFLDADDEWLPEFLSTIMRLRTTYGECGVYATSYCIVCGDQPERRAILRGIPAAFSEGVLEDYFKVATNSDPPVWSSAVAVRKSTLLNLGGFPVGVIAGEDLLTWARLAERTDVAYSSTPLARFYAPDAMTYRPPRIPQQPDVVGHGLLALLENAPPERREGLRGYLGLWHRIRGVVFLKLDRGADAREEIGKGIRYSGTSARLAMLYLLSFLPGTLSSNSYRQMTKFLYRLRSARPN
jgi:glycosyltransferase involved in cell wall biosynthesis